MSPSPQEGTTATCLPYIALKWIVSVRLVLKEERFLLRSGFFNKFKPLFSPVLKQDGQLFLLESDCFQEDCYVSGINLFLRYLVTRQKWWEGH